MVLGSPLQYAVFWVVFAIAFGFFLYRAYRLVSLLRLGRAGPGADYPARRLASTLGHVLFQKCSLKSVSRRDVAGIGHAVLFTGFLLFLLDYVIYIFVGEGLGLSRLIENTAFSRYFWSVLEVAGMLVALAVIWAAVRRYVVRPTRLETSGRAALILAPIFVLMLAHFCLGALRISAAGVGPEGWIPISLALAGYFGRLATGWQESLYRGIWWGHYIIIMGLLVYIPFSKHLHVVTAAVNIFFSPFYPPGTLLPIDLENEDVYGVGRIERFAWKQLLDLYACTECGRCQAACPAHLTGKPLNPKQVVLGLKGYLLEKGPVLLQARTAAPKRALIEDAIPEDVLWSCTTCGACVARCPAKIDPLNKIVEMRRYLVLSEAIFPPEMKIIFKNVRDNGNPWPKASLSRGDWAIGLGLDKPQDDGSNGILFWVGCFGSYDERVQRVSQALLRVLKAAGVNVWTLGAGERCCGDSVRRAGNEYLFQQLAVENIRQLKKQGVTRIITHCPHCYNTLKNEYPLFGGEFEVMHHTELLGELLSKSRTGLTGSGSKLTITYHDPCYLGRYNGLYRPARMALGGITGIRLKEMDLSRQESFCCGGGGARLWMGELLGRSISRARVEQALAVKPDIIATACPGCLTMFEEALRETTAPVKVADIAEIIEGPYR